MASRNRTQGADHFSSSNSGPAVRYETRYVGGAHEFRSTDTTTGCASPWTDYESITDQTQRFGRYNGCTHVRNFPISYSISEFDMNQGGDPSHAGVWHDCGYKIAAATGKLSFNSLIPSWPEPNDPSFSWGDLVSSVGTVLDGSMEASTNVLVAIAEIGKTIGMMKNPFGLVNGNTLKKVKRLSARAIMKSGADMWLEYRYGWKNLYRDIVALAEIRGRVDQHIQYLLNTQNRWTSCARTHEYTTDISSYSPSPIGSASNNLLMSPNLKTYTVKHCFSLDVKRTAAVQKFSYLDRLMQASGSRNVVEALWDLVPFSFVFDWFVNIDRFLVQNPIYWGQHDLRRLGYSTKQIWTGSLTLEQFATGWDGTEVKETVRPEQIVRSSYERVSGFPSNTSTVGLFGGLNLTHLADFTALIAQRL